MSSQTIQHHDASQNAEKLQLISDSQHLSWKAMIMPNDDIFLHKWLSCALLVTLIGAVAISGCTSEYSGEQGKITQQEKGSAATKPVHKEVGEASWYGPGFQGKEETANGETFDQEDMTAAHPTLPMGTKAKVTSRMARRSRSESMTVGPMPRIASSISPGLRLISLI